MEKIIDLGQTVMGDVLDGLPPYSGLRDYYINGLINHLINNCIKGNDKELKELIESFGEE